MDPRECEYQRVYTQIDLDAIVQNTENMKENLKQNTQIVAVIKADGYGHGSVPIAKCLEGKEYIFGFAVATAEEAHILRLANISKPIIVLDYTFPYSYEMMVLEDIRPIVFRDDMVDKMSQTALEQGKKIKVHIKVDTGMSRVGIMPDDLGMQFVKRLSETPGIEIEGILTHFACADEEDKRHARRQLEVFTTFIERIEKELSLVIPIKHCSNSAAILELQEANMNMVRAGIAMYGLFPSPEIKRDGVLLQPALSLCSHIIHIKTLYAGQRVSYNGIFTAKQEMKVATIPVGYGDGYPRSLSNKGYILIHGQKAPILGRICMDQFMVDITKIPQAHEGDKVTLIGKDGDTSLSAETIGEMSGRFNYELVCDLGKRIPRVYIQNGKVVGTKDYYSDV